MQIIERQYCQQDYDKNEHGFDYGFSKQNDSSIHNCMGCDKNGQGEQAICR